MKEIRKLKNLTQEELAKRLDVSPQDISAIERGQYALSAEKLQRLAKALGVTIGEIMGEKPAEPEKPEPLNKRTEKAQHFFRAKHVPEDDKVIIEKLIEIHEERAKRAREKGGKDGEEDSSPDI